MKSGNVMDNENAWHIQERARKSDCLGNRERKVRNRKYGQQNHVMI